MTYVPMGLHTFRDLAALLTSEITRSTKLTLYASLSDKIADHRKVLGSRQDTLEEVRNTLIRNGGNVVQVRGVDDVVHGGAMKTAVHDSRDNESS